MVMTLENDSYNDLVGSLREQLKLQQAINCQFELDLEARDELVSMLQARLKHSEETINRHCAELEQRRLSMKSLGHTVSKLEKLCHELEDELEKSREESRISEASEQQSDMDIENTQRYAFMEQQIEELAHKVKDQDDKFDLLNQERQYATENISRLEGLVRQRDADLEQARLRIVESEREVGELRSQVSSAAREHARQLDELKRLYDELEKREVMTSSQLESAIQEKAQADVMVHTLQEQTTHLTNEIQHLRRQVHDLKQESADKEVKIVHLNKLHQQHQEDKAGLNMALDAKQQELEFIKRKFSVKGAGGITPASSRALALESSSRRGSLGFTTPQVRPRPSSAIGMSDPGQEMSTPTTKTQIKEDNLTTVKPNKVGLPMTSYSSQSSHNLRHEATPGKPQINRRYLKSVNGTPAVSTSRKTSHHRRSSSITSTSSIASGSEKENGRRSTSTSMPTSSPVPA